MELVITLTKTVVDTAEAEVLTEVVKTKLADYPDVKVQSYVHNNIEPGGG